METGQVTSMRCWVAFMDTRWHLGTTGWHIRVYSETLVLLGTSGGAWGHLTGNWGCGVAPQC